MPAAELWASAPLPEETPAFERFPRGRLDVRCAAGVANSVCYLDGDDLEAVLAGSPSTSRVADLLPEAHRRILG